MRSRLVTAVLMLLVVVAGAAGQGTLAGVIRGTVADVVGTIWLDLCAAGRRLAGRVRGLRGRFGVAGL
jgi:hypothetical protein